MVEAYDDTLELLDYPEVQRILSLSRTTVWRLVQRGQLRTVKVGGRALFPRTEIDAYVARLREWGG